jgi:hypothetical protein
MPSPQVMSLGLMPSVSPPRPHTADITLTKLVPVLRWEHGTR